MGAHVVFKVKFVVFARIDNVVKSMADNSVEDVGATSGLTVLLVVERIECVFGNDSICFADKV